MSVFPQSSHRILWALMSFTCQNPSWCFASGAASQTGWLTHEKQSSICISFFFLELRKLWFLWTILCGLLFVLVEENLTQGINTNFALPHKKHWDFCFFKFPALGGWHFACLPVLWPIQLCLIQKGKEKAIYQKRIHKLKWGNEPFSLELHLDSVWEESHYDLIMASLLATPTPWRLVEFALVKSAANANEVNEWVNLITMALKCCVWKKWLI